MHPLTCIALISPTSTFSDTHTEASPLYPSPVPAPTTSDDDNPLLLGQKQDMQAAAVVFVEMVCAALALDGPRANPMTAGAAQRLLFEVFDDNVDDFR